MDFVRNNNLVSRLRSASLVARSGAIPRRSLLRMNNKTYKLETGSKGGKIAAALVKMCQVGAVGEPLLRSGVSQDAFCIFLARVAEARLKAGKTPEQVADAFILLSGGNASAARQALNDCTVEFEGEKPTSVGAYWLKAGGGKAAPNLSALDD